MEGGCAERTGLVPWAGPAVSTLRRAPTPGEPLASGIVTGEGGRLYARASDGALLELAPASRRLVSGWALPSSESAVPAALSNGTIVIADGANLRAVGPDGDPRWSVALGAEASVSPLVLSGGDVLIGDRAGDVESVHADGAVRWRARLASAVVALAADDLISRTVFVATAGGSLYGLDLRDGGVRWTSELVGVPSSSLVVSPKALVVAGTSDGVHAVTMSGAARWMLPLPDGVQHLASARDGGVLATTPSGALLAAAPDGALRWSYPLGSASTGAPTIDVTGTVYVATADGNVHAVRDGGGAGSKLWSVQLGASPRGTPVIGPLARLDIALSSGGWLELGAPLDRGATLLSPSVCPCATNRCAAPLDACAAEPGCTAIVACAVAKGCRGERCRRRDLCGAVLDAYGGPSGQSGLLAYGVSSCLESECSGC